MPQAPDERPVVMRSLLLALAILAAVHPPARAQADAVRSYRNPVHGWSIAYPADWRVDSQHVNFVRLLPPPGGPGALLGIHAGPVAAPTVDSIIAMVVTLQANSAQGIRVLSRTPILLADSTPAVDLQSELGHGTIGRSRRIFALVNGVAFVIDAETFREAWPQYEATFDGIIRSFRVRPEHADVKPRQPSTQPQR